jgi:uncharacterized phage-associated protein
MHTNHISKLYYFEYTINGLLEWYVECGRNEDQNDLSILKTLKLLFFVSAVNAEADNKKTLLDTTFDNFVAMPFGHVESSIYNDIKERGGLLEYFRINNIKTEREKKFSNVAGADREILKEIDTYIRKLKEKNSELILQSAFDLVEISHLWYSWQINYKKASLHGKGSYSINVTDIKSEHKIFHI